MKRPTILALLLALSCSGCGDKAPEKKAFKPLIEAKLAYTLGDIKLRSLRCPDDIAGSKGSSVECQAELEPSGSIPVRVTFVGSDGQFKLEIPKLVFTKATQTALLTRYPGSEQADCGEKPFHIAKPGAEVRCELRYKGVKVPLRVELDTAGISNIVAEGKVTTADGSEVDAEAFLQLRQPPDAAEGGAGGGADDAPE